MVVFTDIVCYDIEQTTAGVVMLPGIAQRCVRKGGDPMVSYDSLFQYTIVLLTVVLVTIALIKRKK